MRAVRTAGTYSNRRTLLFSWEAALTGGLFIRPPGHTENYSQVEHLRSLWKGIVEVADELVFLLTVRRQDSWLASLYAQKSVRIEGASQVDFESQVAAILDCGDLPIPLDLDATVAGLLSRFPRSRVVLLPIELIRTRRYRDTLNEVLDTELLPSSWASEMKNVRHIGGASWHLREFRPELRDSHSYRRTASDDYDLVNRKLTLSPGLREEVMKRVSHSNLAVLTHAPLGLPGYEQFEG